MTDQEADTAHPSPLDVAQRRIVEHPGFKEKELYDGLARTLYAVFAPNRNELISLLDRAKNDSDLAIELFQNMWRPVIRIQFEGAVMRALHNYVASAMALVDHTRRIMRGRSGRIVDEFERRKLAILAHPEIPFIHNLRNYVLHHSLPFIGHQVRVQPEPGIDATTEIRLSTRELGAWDGWSAAARGLHRRQPRRARIASGTRRPRRIGHRVERMAHRGTVDCQHRSTGGSEPACRQGKRRSRRRRHSRGPKNHGSRDQPPEAVKADRAAGHLDPGYGQ